MAMSSGLRTALGEGASWLFAGAVIVGGVIYHQEIRATFASSMGLAMGVSPGATATQRYSEAELRARAAEARAREAEERARTAEAKAGQQQPQAQQARRQAQGGNYGGVVELKAGRNGHFYANAELNGRTIGVLVDTGASAVALTYEDAQKAGIYVNDADFTGRSQTANGVGRYAPVMIDQISIGNVVVQNVQGVVLAPGRSQVTLLGMSFLSKLRRTEMRDGMLVLEN